MAKKQLTVEEYNAKAEKKNAKSKKFSKVFLGSIAVLLSLVMTFSVVSIAFAYMAGGVGGAVSTNGTANNGDSSVYDDGASDDETPDWDAQDPSGDAGDGATDGDGADGTTNGDDGDENGAPTTPMAQYNLFMKAFTGVKTNAKSATLVKKNAYNHKNHVKAGALSALGETLMGSLLKAEDVNQTFTGKDIANNFPPSGTTCNLKTDDISAISCKEEGNFYVITVKVKGEINPKFGYGVGSVATILTKESIQEPISSVPLINKIEPKCAYETTEVVAKIDKATGNLVEYYFNLPMILFMDSYEIGLGFEEWWTVAY